MDRTLCSLLAGATGAGALTLVHQTARLATPYAPRMDVLGMRAIRSARSRLGLDGRSDRDLEREALAGDMVANTAYYALIGAGGPGSVWTRGLALGLVAGLGAVLLPRHVGLGDPPNAHLPATQAMTIAWYVIGGLAAAAAFAANGSDAGQPAALVAGRDPVRGRQRPLARRASR